MVARNVVVMVTYFAQDRLVCPNDGTRMQWIWTDPPEAGWDECPRCHSQWRLSADFELRPKDEIVPPVVGTRRGAASSD